MSGSSFLKTLAGIVLLAWNPVVFVLVGGAAGVALGVKAARTVSSRARQRRMISTNTLPVIPDWQLQHIPIEQRDWVRRNILN